MTAPKELLDLVDRFDRGRDAYRAPSYNGTKLRREFLDPWAERRNTPVLGANVASGNSGERRHP